MKKMYLTAAALSALLIPACSQTQQQGVEQPLPTSPEAVTVDASRDEPQTAETSATEESSPADETGQKVHVCSGLLSCKLGLCPNGQKKRAEMAARGEADQTATEPPESEKEDTEEASTVITPSPEQIAAAEAAMQREDSAPPAKRPRRQDVAETEPSAKVAPEPSIAPTTNTSGIPGRSGLRMGRFAPQEEAASRADATAPKPNAAERHGLRSPSLPKSLPMNIEGKTQR